LGWILGFIAKESNTPIATATAKAVVIVAIFMELRERRL
jgi:hypothetical protein